MINLRFRYILPPACVAEILGLLVAMGFFGYGLPRYSAALQQQSASDEFDKIIDRIFTGEKQYVQNLEKYSPRVETYLQYGRPDAELGETVTDDAYFLGRLNFGGKAQEIAFASGNRPKHAAHRSYLTPRVVLSRFATSTMVDAKSFDRRHYSLTPSGWGYLGDVRCLALDVSPLDKHLAGAFQGRIWVEDHNYAIVRVNGTRLNPALFNFYAHFDSWRENLRPSEWLPVYIYSEESDARAQLRYKSNTRLWGYDLSAPHPEEEWTRIFVDPAARVQDRSESGADLSPLESQRQLEMEAEQNVLERLEKARLVAPAGPVDKVMETVLNNLVVTNHLENLPPLHCRVLLTSPLESFTLRYTIVVSRGLLDVLPDEPSLAMVMAHELAHVVLGHKIDTKYAFHDRLLLPDEQILANLDLARQPEDEEAADAHALEFLKNSPYREKLGNAGLFLRAAAASAPHTPELFGAHLGNRLTNDQGAIRLAALIADAPQLDASAIDQIAALPLGARLCQNAWDGSVDFPHRKLTAPLDLSEKIPFRVSPVFPQLVRYEELSSSKLTAQKTP